MSVLLPVIRSRTGVTLVFCSSAMKNRLQLGGQSRN